MTIGTSSISLFAVFTTSIGIEAYKKLISQVEISFLVQEIDSESKKSCTRLSMQDPHNYSLFVFCFDRFKGVSLSRTFVSHARS